MDVLKAERAPDELAYSRTTSRHLECSPGQAGRVSLPRACRYRPRVKLNVLATFLRTLICFFFRGTIFVENTNMLAFFARWQTDLAKVRLEPYGLSREAGHGRMPCLAMGARVPRPE